MHQECVTYQQFTSMERPTGRSKWSLLPSMEQEGIVWLRLTGLYGLK